MYVQWNCCIKEYSINMDTAWGSTIHVQYSVEQTTVKPVYLYSGHLGTQKNCPDYRGVLIFHRFIYTHLYCNGTTTDCPYYRGVLI